MENFNYFFRGISEQVPFDMFGPVHITLLLIAVLGCIGLVKRGAQNRKIELLIGCTLLTQQTVLYTWYISSGYNLLKEGLPLYHCRIAIIFLGIGLIFKKHLLKQIGSIWGFIGGIAALAYPGVDPFAFPHITQFSFFIGHFFLVWGATYCLFVQKIDISKNDYKKLIVFTNIYHISMFFLNQALQSNYGYMRISPIGIGNNLPPIVYGAIVICLFNVILTVFYKLLNCNDDILEEENEIIEVYAN